MRFSAAAPPDLLVEVEGWFVTGLFLGFGRPGHGDPYDLPQTHWGWAEANVRNVQRTIWPEGHCGGQREPCSDFFEAVVGYAQNLSGTRSRKRVSRSVLKNVQEAFTIEGEAKYGSDPGHDGLYMATPRKAAEKESLRAIELNPSFAEGRLHRDPRFRALVERIGLPAVD